MKFQSTLPTRGSDAQYHILSIWPNRAFQSTLPTRGSDEKVAGGAKGLVNFNPRSPRGGATTIRPLKYPAQDYFNPRSPRGGATRAPVPRICAGLSISIHAPHEGERQGGRMKININIGFQSTLPTRGSDAKLPASTSVCVYFNPRSPRGGATAPSCPPLAAQRISIHAPHEGERPVAPPPSAGLRDFNPRSPRGGATPLSLLPLSLTKDFNPRSPRGGATKASAHHSQKHDKFQSTLPTRGSDSGKVHLYAAFPRIC